MTSFYKIKYNTDNEKISNVLIDNGINIIILNNNTLFEYINNQSKNKILIAEFKYKDKIVSQAFYLCDGEYKGTWLPFDGIKANVDNNNKFYKYIDNSAFKNKEYPFGDESLMAVSYLLGGGVWCHSNSDFRNKLNVDERISYTSEFRVRSVDFAYSLYINQYINYSISRNYFDKHPQTNMRPKSPKWVENKGTNKNDQKLFSAFDFSYKMNNSNQIEYTPPVSSDKNSIKDYKDFYKMVDESNVEVPEKQVSFCNIL